MGIPIALAAILGATLREIPDSLFWVAISAVNVVSPDIAGFGYKQAPAGFVYKETYEETMPAHGKSCVAMAGIGLVGPAVAGPVNAASGLLLDGVGGKEKGMAGAGHPCDRP